MSTRKTTSIVLLVASFALATIAHAGDFAMAGGDMSAQVGAGTASAPITTMEPVSRSASGGDTMGYSQASTSESTSEGASTARIASDTDVSAPATAPIRAAAPASTPAAQTRARSSNRWQSLVPGAIK